ncbi:hypothetical protein EDS67_29115 [candidate division KSB1 bacterium]|nr:MAG: hypothetical protein EDS67_29115 [candidate division KSB1 bacterium]MBC6948715.1 hypothetical protein [candidate division KSB1 bacterium]MCE7945520.1 hypothetical protein [Chlorobi bacterium CHB1]
MFSSTAARAAIFSFEMAQYRNPRCPRQEICLLQSRGLKISFLANGLRFFILKSILFCHSG